MNKINTFIIMYNEGNCENCHIKASVCAKNKQCKIYELGHNFRKVKENDDGTKKII